jgi:hypothetical protein
MVERLFFDRIDAEPRTATVGGQYHLSALVFSYKTESAVPRLEPTFAGTKIAHDSSIVCIMPPTARNGSVGKQVTGRMTDRSIHDLRGVTLQCRRERDGKEPWHDDAIIWAGNRPSEIDSLTFFSRDHRNGCEPWYFERRDGGEKR